MVMFTAESGTRSTSFRLKLWEEQLAVELEQRAIWPGDQATLSPRADICTGSCSMRGLGEAGEDGDILLPEREERTGKSDWLLIKVERKAGSGPRDGPWTSR